MGEPAEGAGHRERQPNGGLAALEDVPVEEVVQGLTVVSPCEAEHCSPGSIKRDAHVRLRKRRHSVANAPPAGPRLQLRTVPERKVPCVH